ncbi:zf-HC2 domain-containing protein [Dyella humi]|uniref:Zf-HC2 domain-containing protein n=1 Tax=Dyella humi TaxID=1770547 RepID=A0ABW8IMC8_9GAMM
MNGRVIKFEGSLHAEADRLLPWYVNGTLEDDARSQVEQHLVECTQCQREVAWLRTLQEEFAEQADKDDVSPRMRRLHRRMESRRRRAPAASVWRHRERQLAWLAALQAVIILALGGVLLRQQHVDYRTLSAPGSKGALLVVMFDPHTRESQLRELVRASGARIAGGPTDEGAYVLRVADTHEAAARKLLLNSPQVTLVEDLSSGGNP